MSLQFDVGREKSILAVREAMGRDQLIFFTAQKSIEEDVYKRQVQDRPGVTRTNRWFTIGKGFELLDTPGVLWPKFEDPRVGELLAFTGAVKDQVIDTEALAARLLETLRESYPSALCTRYKLTPDDLQEGSGYDLLARIGKKRGMLISGGEIDTERAAAMLLDEFRSAKLGKITLERAN